MMKYCPICNNVLQPGSVCTCGWDPTKDYENYPTLAFVGEKRLTANALRRKYAHQQMEEYVHQQLSEQKKAYEAQICELKEGQQLFAARIERTMEAQRQGYETRLQTMKAQQQGYETRLQTMEAQRQEYETEIQALKSHTQELEFWKQNHENDLQTFRTQMEAFNKQLKNLQAGVTDIKAKVDGRKQASAGKEEPHSNPKNIEIKAGSNITFGRMPQTKGTVVREPIVWTVLKVEGDMAFLISKCGLEVKAYNNERKSVVWEKCTLRHWLNRDFYNSVFNEQEKARILFTKVTPDLNPQYMTSFGNTVTDRIFLLSIAEVMKYWPLNKDRICAPTAKAISDGAYINIWHNPGGQDKYSCLWWLRTPGEREDYAAGIDTDGSIRYMGSNVSLKINCVRPAMWIKLKN